MKHYRLLLTVLLLAFIFVLVACSDTPDVTSTDTETETSTSAVESSTLEDTTSSTPFTTVDTPTTKPPKSLLYEEKVVSIDGFITVPSASYTSGTLLHIAEENPFRYNTPALIPNNKIPASYHTVPGQDLMLLYGNKSQDYLLSSSSIFMKSDAFDYWEQLVALFREETGKTSLQVVNGYLYNSETAINNHFVTGYSVAVNLYEDGITYALSSENKSVTVDGKTMTCLSWFLDHCAQFGFIYTGLTGTQGNALATFRFVGVPFALNLSFYDIIDMEVFSDFIRKTTPNVVINDPATDTLWTFQYFPASTDSDLTVIRLPIGATYAVSGDNIGGFIVAYHMPKDNANQ